METLEIHTISWAIPLTRLHVQETLGKNYGPGYVWCHKWEHKHLSMFKEVFFDLLPLCSKCYKYAPGHDISYFHKSNCTSTDKFSKWDEIQSKLFYFHSQKWRRTAPRIPVPNTVLQKSTKIYQLPLLIPGNWAKKL